MTDGIIVKPSRFSIEDLKRRADLAAAAATEHADSVDRDASFPVEAFANLREQCLLGILVPVELGGEGAGIGEIVDICYILGQACASTAMIYAMHQIMAAILVRHARDQAWHEGLL